MNFINDKWVCIYRFFIVARVQKEAAFNDGQSFCVRKKVLNLHDHVRASKDRSKATTNVCNGSSNSIGG